MKKIDCSICDKKAVAVAETIKVDGAVYCDTCFETEFEDPAKMTGKLIVKEADPTVCAFCQQDFGVIELPKLSVHPICDGCDAARKNKILPNWVKIFFIGILAIVVIAFIWNWRFYDAYQNYKKANVSFATGDYTNASLLMEKASQNVPEVEDLATLAHYFTGAAMLKADKNVEALKALELCKDKLPKDYDIDRLISAAKMGITFDDKNYEGFLAAAKETLTLDSSAMSLGAIASAYACIYAEKGDPQAQKNALKFLDEAKQRDSTSDEALNFFDATAYRLHSRKIISREEFNKQFPNGWVN